MHARTTARSPFSRSSRRRRTLHARRSLPERWHKVTYKQTKTFRYALSQGSLCTFVPFGCVSAVAVRLTTHAPRLTLGAQFAAEGACALTDHSDFAEGR